MDEYARLINSVRVSSFIRAKILGWPKFKFGPIQLAFNSRIRTYQAWQSADAEVRRVKQNNERARGHARIPVVSLNVLAEVRSKLVKYFKSSVIYVDRLNDELWTQNKSSTIARS